MDTYNVRIQLVEPMLGTAPMAPDIYRDWIVDKAIKMGVALTEEQIAEELASLGRSVDDELQRGTTGFHRDANRAPCLMDYFIKGFLKESCYHLRKVDDSLSKKLTAYKKLIDGLVFVKPRFIPIELSGDLYIIERPLRAQTMQGERVALARSEAVPAGSTMEFRLLVLGEVTEKHLTEWFDYGELHGLGCWRNATWGTFTYTMAKGA